MGGIPPSIFDGTRFFSLEDYGFPASTQIYNFAQSTDDAVWIAAASGLYRFAEGHVESISRTEATSVIAAAPDVAIATMNGNQAHRLVVRFSRSKGNGEGWKSETVFPLDGPGPLSANADGTATAVWPYKGLVEFHIADVVAWRAGTPPPKLTHIIVAGAPGNGTLKVMRDRHGCFWWGVDGFNSGACGTPHDEPSDLPKGPPTPIAWDHLDLDANMHETHDRGMILWGRSILILGYFRYRTAAAGNGLPPLKDALGASDGTLWLGTAQGLYRFPAPFRMESWSAGEGVSAPAWSITRVKDRIYAGLADRIVVLNKEQTRWDPFAEVPGNHVTSLLATKDGDLLASSQYGGVRLFSPTGKLLAQTMPGQPQTGNITRIAYGRGEEIWVGGDELGTLTREGKSFRYTPLAVEGEQPLGLRNILSIRYQPEVERLWACYNGGLLMRDGQGTWHKYTPRDGLADEGCQSLVTLPTGDVWDAWFHAPSLGLIRLGARGLSVHLYSAKEIESPVSAILSLDSTGNLWRSAANTSFVASPAQAESGKWLRFDESDGFPADFNGGSFFADSDGSVWVGAGSQIFHYSPPADLTAPKFTLQFFVSAWSIDKAPALLAEAVGVIPHGSQLTAHIGSLQFDRRSALRIRYRLAPGQAWIETKSLDIPVGSLSSGAHKLEIQGRVLEGPWSSTVSHSFQVGIPVWMTIPWLLAYAATVLALIATWFVRQRQLREEKQLVADFGPLREKLFESERAERHVVLDSRFEIGEEIAEGGFATVYQGFDRETCDRCAVKIFHEEITDRTWLQRRFEQEVAALTRIRHPNIVAIYAHGQTASGTPYLVMEFIQGKSLRDLLSEGPLSHGRTAAILEQLAEALATIHASEIWHRDVTPENILIRSGDNREGQVVLIDFSIAIVKQPNVTIHALTHPAGTIDYMAPEQVMGYADARSDVYSLSRITLEMLSGKKVKDLLPGASLDLPAQIRVLLKEMLLGLSDESIEMLALAQLFEPSNRPKGARDFAAPIIRDLRLSRVH